VFIGAHFGLGYLIGPPVVAIVGGALGALAVGVVVLSIVGAAGWVALGRWRRRRGQARQSRLASVATWADACCPACLAIGVLDSRAAG
jgi:hypothetical protein